ncbi:ATP synthase subunit delta [Neomoorella glycerini]|uniref:ATP synthase subunit delta n=1 Tax=Neomoorella glycerini TaxID=55779 RepID=A0A6I5ZP99_9FIRM|nr:ATP synthase F1 subunit delta [Moorella glycerini]QGP91762.1 ATP synthase subunit delta [Moorella glycerini]
MSSQTIARRYARALFEVARQKGALAGFAAALERVGQALAENPELRRVLYHQLIPVREKQRLMDTLFPDVDPLLKNFFHLVLAKGRERALPEMAAQFRRLVDRENRVLPVEVQAAAPLSEEVTATLKERLAHITGQNIRLQTALDPALLGGMVIRLGDRVLDASLKKKLELLGEHLKGA